MMFVVFYAYPHAYPPYPLLILHYFATPVQIIAPLNGRNFDLHRDMHTTLFQRWEMIGYRKA